MVLRPCWLLGLSSHSIFDRIFHSLLSLGIRSGVSTGKPSAGQCPAGSSTGSTSDKNRQRSHASGSTTEINRCPDAKELSALRLSSNGRLHKLSELRCQHRPAAQAYNYPESVLVRSAAAGNTAACRAPAGSACGSCSPCTKAENQRTGRSWDRRDGKVREVWHRSVYRLHFLP